MCSVLLCEVRERRQEGLGEHKETCVEFFPPATEAAESGPGLTSFTSKHPSSLVWTRRKSGETSKLINLHVRKKNILDWWRLSGPPWRLKSGPHTPQDGPMRTSRQINIYAFNTTEPRREDGELRYPCLATTPLFLPQLCYRGNGERRKERRGME